MTEISQTKNKGKSGKLARLEETIYFGEHEILAIEQSHKSTKKFLKFLAKTFYDGYNVEIGGEGFTDLLESIFTEKPYEALKIYIPELTEDIFDEATNRELIHNFKVVMKLNGMDIDKITKNVKPLIERVNNLTPDNQSE